MFYIPDTSCRSRLATLNEKLTQLERRVEYIEARVCITVPDYKTVLNINGIQGIKNGGLIPVVVSWVCREKIAVSISIDLFKPQI
jgi:hypothetical protein